MDQKKKELGNCMGATQNCINLDPISYFHHGSKAPGLGVVAIGTSCYDLFENMLNFLIVV